MAKVDDFVELYSVPEIADQTLLIVSVGIHFDYGLTAEWFLIVLGEQLTFHAQRMHVALPGGSMRNAAPPEFLTPEVCSRAARLRAQRYLRTIFPATTPLTLKPEPQQVEFLQEIGLAPHFNEARKRVLKDSYFDVLNHLLRDARTPFEWETQQLG